MPILYFMLAPCGEATNVQLMIIPCPLKKLLRFLQLDMLSKQFPHNRLLVLKWPQRSIKQLLAFDPAKRVIVLSIPHHICSSETSGRDNQRVRCTLLLRSLRQNSTLGTESLEEVRKLLKCPWLGERGRIEESGICTLSVLQTPPDNRPMSKSIHTRHRQVTQFHS